MTPTQNLQHELQQNITETLSQNITIQELVNWAEQQHWELTESENPEPETIETEFLRNILYHIIMEYENNH